MAKKVNKGRKLVIEGIARKAIYYAKAGSANKWIVEFTNSTGNPERDTETFDTYPLARLNAFDYITFRGGY